MNSPPHSDSGGTTTPKDIFDTALPSRQESVLTSASSAALDESQPLEKEGQSYETPLGKVTLQDGDLKELLASHPENLYPHVQLERVSVDTLKTYHIDHRIHPSFPGFVTIQRPVPDYEMEFLKAHTKYLQNQPVEQKQPVDETQEVVAEPPASSDTPQPTIVTDEAEPKLLLQINRVPFEKWLSPVDEVRRGGSVLDVAMRSQEAPTTSSDAVRPSDSDCLSPDSQQDICMPVRLAINSSLILSQINKITKHQYPTYNKVMYPPWKLLVTYREDIKKRLHELEEKVAEQPTESPSIEDVPSQHTPPVVPKTQTDQVDPSTKTTKDEEELHSPKTCELCDSDLHSNSHRCLVDTVSHLKILVGFMENDLKPVFELRRGLEDGTIIKIAFRDLWHLYRPGQLLITSGPSRGRQLYRIFYVCRGNPLVRDRNFEKVPLSTPFTIHCYRMDCDKKWLGPVHYTITIPQYHGERLVTALQISYSESHLPGIRGVFPVRFLEDREATIANIVQRGRRFRELIPFSHKWYCGPSTVEDPEYLNSEIIIDNDREEDNRSIGVFDNIVIDDNEIPEGCNVGEPCWGCTDLYDDDIIDNQLASQYKQDQHLLSRRSCYDENLTDEHFMLLPSSINAFVLRERDTFGVYVELIKDLSGDHGESLETLKKQSGFQDLVLPEGHGDLVEALVRNHGSTMKPRDEEEKVQVDLIDGKGEGLIILLHGVPGVGKTSTAECVASYTGRPLYPITCANIGLDPEAVERNLTGPSGHFRTAQQWNCVVLLDEADVFLAKRDARDNDAKHNALVSVFLRTLEYYSGILILTTNRVGSFDEAVISRIKLFLYYPPLDEEKTLKVWRVHINRVRASQHINIDREDEVMIMDFAKEEYTKGRRWNGRQIRNFFQTAISLASYDATKWRQKDIEDGQIDKDSTPTKPRLTTRTLKIVAATSGKFIEYISATLPDASHADQQLTEGNRNDTWR